MFELGTIIGGKYCLEEKIGEGGMASVWRAVHMDLDRPVAVKFMSAVGPRAPELARRFLKEAQVAASIRHRNVVGITDFGRTDDGQPFMVMDLLRGEDLEMRLERSIHVVDLVRIVCDALRGLAAVHEAGIVHRDVKPGNIFLDEEHEDLVPKLLDFGISKGSTMANVPKTLDGTFVGTPEYMSPEQARGLSDIDLRTDIYSMGVVLYEGLTGRLPFRAEAPGDLILQVISEVAPTVVSLRPDVGQPLSNVVERAMARDRDARYPDAEAMRMALRDAVERTAAVSAVWTSMMSARAHPELPTSRTATTDPLADEPVDLPRASRWKWLAIPLTVAAAIGGYIAWSGRAVPPTDANTSAPASGTAASTELGSPSVAVPPSSMDEAVVEEEPAELEESIPASDAAVAPSEEASPMNGRHRSDMRSRPRRERAAPEAPTSEDTDVRAEPEAPLRRPPEMRGPAPAAPFTDPGF